MPDNRLYNDELITKCREWCDEQEEDCDPGTESYELLIVQLAEAALVEHDMGAIDVLSDADPFVAQVLVLIERARTIVGGTRNGVRY